jgi:hypothetical protein
MIVHSVSSVAVASQHQLPSSWPNGQQPIENFTLRDFAMSFARHFTASLPAWKLDPKSPVQICWPDLSQRSCDVCLTAIAKSLKGQNTASEELLNWVEHSLQSSGRVQALAV